ncbi:MAG: hypothetical protein NVSMB66_3660 [Candidatus Doudnabacteria bacterium]
MKMHMPMWVWVLGIALTVILLLVYIPSLIQKRRQERKLKQEAEDEMHRIALLPTLYTENLIEVPNEFVSQYYRDNPPQPGTFSIRSITVIVADREGKIWMGFFNSDTFESLAKAEYERANLWVPQVGLDDIYPVFINNDEQRPRWYELHQNYLREYEGKTRHQPSRAVGR